MEFKIFQNVAEMSTCTNLCRSTIFERSTGTANFGRPYRRPDKTGHHPWPKERVEQRMFVSVEYIFARTFWQNLHSKNSEFIHFSQSLDFFYYFIKFRKLYRTFLKNCVNLIKNHGLLNLSYQKNIIFLSHTWTDQLITNLGNDY